MLRWRQVLLCACVLFCLAAIYVPLLVAGYAVSIAIEALWSGQLGLGVRAILIALVCGVLWLTPIPGWYLVRKVFRGLPGSRARVGSIHATENLWSKARESLAQPEALDRK